MGLRGTFGNERHAQKFEPFQYLGRVCAAMPKLRTLSPKIAPKVHPPTIDQKNAFLHQTLIKNCDRKEQLNFSSFGMMSPVFQKCEPFASFCEDKQKSEPFGGHAQKCEPFAWACNPSLPVTPCCEHLLLRSMWAQALTSTTKGFQHTKQTRKLQSVSKMDTLLKCEEDWVFGKALPKSANPLRTFAKSLNPFQVVVTICTKVRTLSESSPKIRTLPSFWQDRAQKCEPFANLRQKCEPFRRSG